MSDLLSVIQSRRSIRNMTPQPVPDETLASLLEAIRWSPSWANTQCWEVVVARETEVKKKLQESLPPKGNPATKTIVEAPVVLVVCAKLGAAGFFKGEASTKFGEWMMFDLGIATQSLCLMAHSMGLGTVVVGLFDHAKAAAALEVPQGYEVVAMVPVGYPAKDASAPKRREVSEFTHYDKW